MDEGKVSDGVNNKIKQDGSNSTSDVDQGIPQWVPAMG